MPNARPQWFAVFTRPSQERRALANLERQGFACFLPEVENGRPLRVAPLFPRYLFLNALLGVQNLTPIRSTYGVRGLVRLSRPVLAQGDRVRVSAGPFAGAEAIFKTEKSGQRVLLLMELLGRQTTVEVEALSLRCSI
jgi:transcriptional antiterminator RfaH